MRVFFVFILGLLTAWAAAFAYDIALGPRWPLSAMGDAARVIRTCSIGSRNCRPDDGMNDRAWVRAEDQAECLRNLYLARFNFEGTTGSAVFRCRVRSTIGEYLVYLQTRNQRVGTDIASYAYFPATKNVPLGAAVHEGAGGF